MKGLLSLARPRSLAALGLMAALGLAAAVPAADDPKPPADQPKPAADQANTQANAETKDKAVERARREVKMLDGIYKNAIVLITTHYVTEETDVPAGVAFKKLFETAKKEGWHEVRLLDATGDPYEPENVAKTDFEKRAIKQIIDGKPYVDEVVKKDGKRYLQAATAIPVVMEKCVMCHAHYGDVAKGKAIGALGYIVPIDE